ncbi:MAG: hypothetical protein QF814_02125 [Candidatus Marinimicrobia bacterium]|jgi:hypothetical protein|nr:hypothetical protein [Candidatus Neomarinimicrobiota bacterium]|tara:strand:+ start:3103 stop:3258 length:156 start_codon:yes stop_codon:yes gene_type:complete
MYSYQEYKQARIDENIAKYGSKDEAIFKMDAEVKKLKAIIKILKDTIKRKL